mgnify:CR=1 FL=1
MSRGLGDVYKRQISLKAINIKYGDEVITAANTAIPTISAIVNCGAKPRLVDVCEDYLMDTSKIEELIIKKQKQSFLCIYTDNHVIWIR